MGNGLNLRSAKMMLNPKGALGSAEKRMKTQSSMASELGLENPYKNKKKKKAESVDGLRNFMDRFIKKKEANMNQL